MEVLRSLPKAEQDVVYFLYDTVNTQAVCNGWRGLGSLGDDLAGPSACARLPTHARVRILASAVDVLGIP